MEKHARTTEYSGRTIFHVDVNSAFLSWSALKRLRDEPGSVDLRTIPSAVGGDIKTRHGVITAKSIPAKKFGVETGEPVVKALQKCPQLVLVPSDFETYRAYSRALMELLHEITPNVQQASIDEAYLDVTEIVRADGASLEVMLPGGAEARAEAAEHARRDVAVPGYAGREAEAPGRAGRGAETPGHARRGAGLSKDRQAAIALAQHIRQSVSARLGFTVNVGISNNKLLAKMASDLKKPDMTHTLYPDEVPAKMWPLPVKSLYGCGRSTAERLNLLGINTIGDAAAADLGILQSVLGLKAGEYIWKSANGIGSTNVRTTREQAKSVSNERTLSSDVSRDNYQSDGIPVIRALAQKVASRLVKSGLAGQTVTFQVKTAGFQRHSRQMVLGEMTDRAEVIEAQAIALADSLLTGTDGLFERGESIRLIGVGVSKLGQKKAQQVHQMDLFEWAEQNEAAEQSEWAEQNEAAEHSEWAEHSGAVEQSKIADRNKMLEEMMEKINSRYGDGTVGRGMR